LFSRRKTQLIACVSLLYQFDIKTPELNLKDIFVLQSPILFKRSEHKNYIEFRLIIVKELLRKSNLSSIKI